MANNTMKQWDKDTVINWVNNLPSDEYNKDNKDQIISGINKFSATGDDIWDASKQDLIDGLGLGSMLAKKLAKTIAAQRKKDLGDNIPGNPTDDPVNNINDVPFELNIGGSKPTRLKNIKSSMTISKIKELYLKEFTNNITTAKMQGVSIKYLGSSLSNSNATLKEYGILNGNGMQLFVTYSLNGGMSANLNNTHKFYKGKEIRCIDPQKNKYYLASIDDIRDDQIQISWVNYPSYAAEWISFNDYVTRIHPKDLSSNDIDDEKDNDKKSPDINNNEYQFRKGQQIECTDTINTTNGIYYAATVKTINNGAIEVEWDSYPDYSAQWIVAADYSERIRIIASTDVQPKKKDDGSLYNALAINKWKGIHTKCWIKSLGYPFNEYADKFEKIDGIQLLDTNVDDLTLIISSKMVRKKLIKHLNTAKSKYKVDISLKVINNNNRECIIGLNNLGNTCFLNTCIQLLSQTPKLSNYFAKRAKLSSLNNNNNNNNGNGGWVNKSVNYLSGLNPFGNNSNNNNIYPMLSAWVQLCDKIYNKNYRKAYSPKFIRDALTKIDNRFGSGKQDDSARAMRIILETLDKEIENEILYQNSINNTNNTYNNGKNINLNEQNRYIINHCKPLTINEEQNVISELSRKHNPNDSIIRKLFDGIERMVIECVNCNKKYQQYITFRDLDIPAVNNHIIFKNINIVYNNDYYTLNECKVLDYCCVDVLKYEIINSSDLKNKNISIDNIDIVIIKNNDIYNINNMKFISSDTKISEISLSLSGSSIFALISIAIDDKKDDIKNINVSYDDDKKDNILNIETNKCKIFQFVVFMNKKCNAIDANNVTLKYINSNINQLLNEFKQSASKNNKYNYQLILNGTVIDYSNATCYDFKEFINEQNCNLLILIGTDKKNNNINFYNSNKTHISVLMNAIKNHPKVLPINALKKYKNNLINNNKILLKIRTITGQTKDETDQFKNKLIKDIDETLCELKKKQNIDKYISVWFKTFQSTSTSITKLNNLNDSLLTYQEPTILDENSYGYKCFYCHTQCRLIKLQKEIIYTPPILILHLDRFNNKNNINNYNYNYNRLTSNKFTHGVHYQKVIEIGKSKNKYNLYGVANHQGSNSEYGHYTATVKGRSNSCWYNISDPWVNSNNIKPLASTTTATIFMYSNVH